MRAVAAAERHGLPAVAIVASGFAEMANTIGRFLGLDHVRLAQYPGVIMTDDRMTLRAKVLDHVLPEVLSALVGPPTKQRFSSERRTDDVYDPRHVVVSGDLDGVHEYFVDRLWTDGLPIIPPTIERVERALRFTSRGADEQISVLAPSLSVATPWNVAVNGVMAGCPPELMPFLLAAVEAISDPSFRLLDAGSTPGWEPLVVVSGPALYRFGFHCGAGVMRVGVRSNTTMGRFVRLFMRNVAGLRSHPESVDKASIGLGFNVAMVEDDEMARRICWPTLREEAGFDADDTVVAVQGVVGISTPIYTGTPEPDSHLDVIAEHLAGVSAHWAGVGYVAGGWWPLLAISPAAATVLANHGLTPAMVRHELATRATVPARLMADYVQHTGVEYFDWARFADDWPKPERFLASDDPNRPIPVLLDPDRLGIVVTGDRGRNQSRIYVNSHAHGARVVKRVELNASFGG